MRITKIKVDNKNVVLQRNNEQGYLLHGGMEKKKKNIYHFILTHKKSSLTLSLLNKILTNEKKLKHEYEKQNLKTLQALFQHIIQTKLNEKSLYNQDIRRFDLLSIEELSIYVKYIFRQPTEASTVSPYLQELKAALARPTQELTQRTRELFPLFNRWIDEKLKQFEHTSNSIQENNIDYSLNTKSNRTSKHKRFLNQLVDKFLSSGKTDSLMELINTIADRYQIDTLVTQLATIESYHEHPHKGRILKSWLHIEYKRALQQHQAALFGSKNEPNLENRNDNELYVYHNEIVNTLQRYFPLHTKPQISAIERFFVLNDEGIAAVFRRNVAKRIQNKLVQLFLVNGKLIHQDKHKIENIDSQYLQGIKVQENLRRKLNNAIAFACYRLKMTFAPMLPKKLFDFIQHENFSEIRRPPASEQERAEQLQVTSQFLHKLQLFNYHHPYLKYYLQLLEAPASYPLSASDEQTMNNALKEAKTLIQYLKSYPSLFETLHDEDILLTNENTKIAIQKAAIINNVVSMNRITQQQSALLSLRNAIYQIQKIRDIPDSQYILQQLKTDITGIPLVLINKLRQNHVTTYYSQEVLTHLLQQPLDFTVSTVPFTPSFQKVFARAQGLFRVWAPLKNSFVDKQPYEQEQRYQAHFVLLNVIYYYQFLSHFIKNGALFKSAINLVREQNRETTGYLQFSEILFTTTADYLTQIQMLENERFKEQQHSKNPNKRNKAQPYFQRYIQDIFIAGFDLYIKEHQNLIQNQLSQNGNDALSEEYFAHLAQAVTTHDLTLLENSPLQQKTAAVWYGLALALDKVHLYELRGEIVKYQQTQQKLRFREQLINGEIPTILKCLNIRGLYAEQDSGLARTQDKELAYTLFVNHFLSPELHLPLPITGIEATHSDSEAAKQVQQFYSSSTQPIVQKVFHRSSCYSMQNVLTHLPVNLITESKWQEFHQQRETLRTLSQEQQHKHKEWSQDKLNFSAHSSYQTLIAQQQQASWLEQRVTLKAMSRLSQLLQDIWQMWINIIYLWERDAHHLSLALLNKKNLLISEEIQKFLARDQRMLDAVYELPDLETNSMIFTLLGMSRERVRDKSRHQQRTPREIHEAILTYRYFRMPTEFSLLDYLSDLYRLMSYDSKLRNMISQMFIDLFTKYGMSLRFKPLQNHQYRFELQSLLSNKVTHFQTNEHETSPSEVLLQTDEVSSEYLDWIKALLTQSVVY